MFFRNRSSENQWKSMEFYRFKKFLPIVSHDFCHRFSVYFGKKHENVLPSTTKSFVNFAKHQVIECFNISVSDALAHVNCEYRI